MTKPCILAARASAREPTISRSTDSRCNVLEFCTAAPSKTGEKCNVDEFCTPLEIPQGGVRQGKSSQPGDMQSTTCDCEDRRLKMHGGAVHNLPTLYFLELSDGTGVQNSRTLHHVRAGLGTLHHMRAALEDFASCACSTRDPASTEGRGRAPQATWTFRMRGLCIPRNPASTEIAFSAASE